MPNWEDGCDPSPPVVQHTTSLLESWDKPQENGHEEATKTVTLYSPTEILVRKDFGKMAEHELLHVQRFIMTMARQMATQFSRRKKAGGKACLIDPGRTMRRSLRYGGEVMEIVHRSRKKSKTKMVVLCDVSGSMNVYTQSLIQFLYGIQNALRGVETIVFSTRLTRITPLLRRRNIHAALALIADTVMDWSGGTKIGACLQEFNKDDGSEHGDIENAGRDHQRWVGYRRQRNPQSGHGKTANGGGASHLAQSALRQLTLSAFVQRHPNSPALYQRFYASPQRRKSPKIWSPYWEFDVRKQYAMASSGSLPELPVVESP